MAERHRRRTIIDLETCILQYKDMTAPAEDDVWANRMVWIHAHVINYCFGPTMEQTTSAWQQLNDDVDQWRLIRPSSFAPLFSRNTDPEGSPFPAVWFLCDWHGKFRLAFSLS